MNLRRLRSLPSRSLGFPVIVALPLFLTAGCVTDSAVDAMKPPDASQQEQRAMLVGSWYGESATKSGGSRAHLMQRAADGTFQVTFRVVDSNGKITEQTEVGVWGTSGPVYFTITRGWLSNNRLVPANPEDASLNDAYQILELTQDRFRYRSLQTKSEYTVKRVPDTFELPGK